MLFHSDVFLFEFLPFVLIGFFRAKGYVGAKAAQVWLAACSIVFYAWAGLSLLPPLALSIVVNFVFGRVLTRRATQARPARLLLALGVSANLLLLGWFKYADFLLGNLQVLGLSAFAPRGIALPLGISFYTFTQIAFLVDAARGEAKEYDFGRYVLFVTFFPHLIAGPIIHHKEMMPQFAPERLSERKFDLMPQALALFVIGLSKKVILADTFASLATPVFRAAAQHAGPDLVSAWGAALAYTFQIYFDFSGYSDMALGLALMFGITLPVNFLSPYMATSIIQFWRTWHMTLSRFLRDYLYFPLGGNRKGLVRRYANLAIVMVLGGLWHGAAWTFVMWGALHGGFLLVNHAWRRFSGRIDVTMPPWVGRPLTFLCVALAWVLFRADSVESARAVYAGLVGFNGTGISADFLALLGVHHPITLAGWTIAPLVQGQDAQWHFLVFCALGFVIVWAFPNSMELTHFVAAPQARLAGRMQFRMTPRFAIVTAVFLFFCIGAINSGAVSEFIYYRF